MFEVKTAESPVQFKTRFNSASMPFKTMEVGQFFFVPCQPNDQNRLSVLCINVGARIGRKFATRATDGGYNIYRTQ